MKFTVIWRPSAEKKLAEIWNEASDRADVTRAANQLDKWLAIDPLQCGEEREAGVRILVEVPLAIYYLVSEDDRLVTVYAVWRWGTSP